MDNPLTFPAWVTALNRRGFTVLPSSHPVPIELWLRVSTPEPGPHDGEILHFRARGTRLVLRAYAADALAGLILRSECDCEQHRTAGAAARIALLPGAAPLAEAVFDGARELSWRAYEAGLLRIGPAARLFDRLLGELGGAGSTVQGNTGAAAAGALEPAGDTGNDGTRVA